MRFDDDDFEDYQDGGLDDDRAFDELTKLVPNATEDEAWDALEEFDYDVEAAAAHLKATLKPAPAPKPAPKPLAKAAPKAAPKAAEVQTDNLKGKSKLQSLALKKQAGSKGGALGKLRMKSTESGEAGDKSEKKSALARLMAKKNDTSRAQSPVADSTSSIASTPTSSAVESRSSTPLASDSGQIAPVQFAQQEIPRVSRPSPSPFGSILGSSVPADSAINSVSNAVKVSQATSNNFSKPSPDDKVVGAQAKAFDKDASKKSAPAPKKKGAPAKTKQKDIARISSLSLKPTLKLVVLGHIDAGKSTLTGRLLIDMGAVPKSVLDKNQREADKIGKSSFALAWVMDATKQERSRGVTVDVAMASFETHKKEFTILDAPGHKDYVPNMITGVSQADVALIVIDAGVNAFEAGFLADGQTKEHAILSRSLGIDHVVVAVNKLETNNWDEDRFEEIKVQVTEFLSKIVGFNPCKIHFVPTSGANGDYVVKSSTAAPWYKGPTLVEALESIEVSHGELDAPFRLASFRAFPELGGHLEVQGVIVSGVVEERDPIVNCNQPDITGTVRTVPTKQPLPGDSRDFTIELDNSDDLARCRDGDLFAAPEGAIPAVISFKANVIFFDLKRPVLSGSKLSFYMGSVNRSVTVTKIIESFDKKGGKIKKNPRHITRGQGARIQFTLDQPVPLAPSSEVNELGRFVLRLGGDTIAAGIVQETMW